MNTEIITEKIRILGTVQGVGFRPTVYRLAKQYQLKGTVSNNGEGVILWLSGTLTKIEQFLESLKNESPPLARIEKIIREVNQTHPKFADFTIISSKNTPIHTAIVPDAATCLQCQKDIFNPHSRWYRYPFTNCTHCGPRLSIIRQIPYDRCHTSMTDFQMCSECEKEYKNVENRRFHAQPIACPQCGPQVWLENAKGEKINWQNFSNLDCLEAVSQLIHQGFIIAIKGLGGVHLACNATDEIAVNRLRERKKRYAKPFALMARDVLIIEQYCQINQAEKNLLTSPQSPIVLLKIKDNKNLASGIAPGQNYLGFMLPYTPLHHLILEKIDDPIILTSGNLSDEPQCIDNQETRDKLGQIADYFLLHNRAIINRVDDSVMRVIHQENYIIRRARGFAPSPLHLPPGFEQIPPILALGGELKNTFCLLQDHQAILSQHLGDLENAITYQGYQNTLNLYLNLFEHQPQIIAIDHHPEYLSTKLGQELTEVHQFKTYKIQHHHAHIAACMAENQLPLNTPPLLGIALDGLGYGLDQTLWGGEFLLADYRQFTRLATFKPIPLLGGKQAIYQPWRNTYAHLNSTLNWQEIQQNYQDLPLIEFLNKQPLSLLNQMQKKGLNSPLISSVGRLFDAVAASLGICQEQCYYEGQAAIELETLLDQQKIDFNSLKPYPWKIETQSVQPLEYQPHVILNPQPLWLELLEDLRNQVSPPIISAKFHQGLADVIILMVLKLKEIYPIHQVVLTGGVMQNTTLLKLIKTELEKLGITVFTHHLVPANDGGISLGQGVIAAAQFLLENKSGF